MIIRIDFISFLIFFYEFLKIFILVEYLVSRGADIELSNKHGHTPLMIAAFKKHDRIVKFLLDSGASPFKASARVKYSYSFDYHDCLSIK